MEINTDLMRQIIIDHYENPRYKVENDLALTKYFSGHSDSPACIDNIDAYVKIINDKVEDIKFKGLGCAICTSSTDIMAKNLIGLNTNRAKLLIENYINMILSKDFDKEMLQDLIVYQNVNKQTNRIKCALTGIQAILKAIENEKK